MIQMKKEALKKHEDGKCLTLDETALAIWDPDKDDKPMSAMGILKIERRALAKLKSKLHSRYGIDNLDDIFDPKHREVARKEVS